LGGTLFAAANQPSAAKAIVFVGGGGVPASRYRHFAAYLAGSNIPVLTFDFRGIGKSRPPDLRGFAASAEDWSESDCDGALNWLRAKFPTAEIIGVAHSVGSLIIGGAPSILAVRRLVFICPHTGYYGDYLPKYRLLMRFMWHTAMPALTRLFGYFPGRMLHLGEDIPAGIAMQWAARRSPDLRPESTNPDPSRARAMLARYATIRAPAFMLTFADDAFATAAGARRLLACYPGIKAQHELIEPRTVGLARIGHFGLFRAGAEERLWPIVLTKIKGM
jgi:predicted alpha/beta hydrolase